MTPLLAAPPPGRSGPETPLRAAPPPGRSGPETPLLAAPPPGRSGPGTLDTPITIGSRVAPSRVMFGPHETNLGTGRRLSDRHVAYYARRARGGVGVIVVETASVEPADWPYERAPLAADCRPGWAAIARACAPEGTLVLAGLGHTGLEGSSAYSQEVLWGPSRVADVVTREPPAEMEQRQIDAVVSGFAGGARAAIGAGLGGVEVDAGPRSLLRQFLSGLTNLRDDDYGSDRARLVREVLHAVRSTVGPDAVVGLRLSCDELAPWAGITPEQASGLVEELLPFVDLLTVVRGGPFSAGAYRPDGHTPPGFNHDLCARIRQVARARAARSPSGQERDDRARAARPPSGQERDDRARAARPPSGQERDDSGPLVVLQGSVVSVDQAQTALDAGTADLVEMTRAHIADPDLVRRVREGTPERIRPCILCNQACLVRDPRNPIVTCVAEPASGFEDDSPADTASLDGSRVAVVGGGPAGLECARVLALGGATVRVVEAGNELGGAARGAAALPGRERFGLFCDWLEAECRRNGASLETRTKWEPADVAAAEADGWTVVLATGSRPGCHPWKAVDVLELCRTGPEVLPDGPVVVDDPIGGPVGVGVAEWLAAAGRPVTLVTPDPVAGTLLARTGDLADANGRLQRAGVRRALHSRLRSADDGQATLEDVWTAARSTVDAAVIVDAGYRLPDDSLGAARPDLLAAGDCVAPRTVLEAVLEGRRLALSVR